MSDRTIALVGTASSSFDKVPWGWPGVDIWCVNSIYKHYTKFCPMVELFWDIHTDPEELHPAWYKWALETQPRVMLQKVDPRLTNSEAFPRQTAISRFGGEYFTSSVAYMMALAIMNEPKSIGIYGIDMAEGTEYQHQRPCVEYFIGIARGMGIPVKIPKNSALLKANWPYGYDPRAPGTYKEQQQNELAIERAKAIHFEKIASGRLTQKSQKQTARRAMKRHNRVARMAR